MNPDNRLRFHATTRNRDFIAAVLHNYISPNSLFLEIASGSGEHAVFFQQKFPSIIWQTSDPELYIEKVLIHGLSMRGFSLKCLKL
tara:strand:- start:632 stop:889 length:258 start_codon:yes stop_codon:yes gene_type:complete